MKLIHISDLHLGIKLHEELLIDDQQYILKKIINVIDEEKPDCLLLCGDIYDKSVPSAQAVAIFDDFLFDVSKRNLQTFIISGNHDSPERIAFGSRIMNSSGIHLSPVYNGNVTPTTLSDKFGEFNIYMLPFLKPALVRNFFPEENIETYTDAVNVAIKKMNIDTNKRNIILSHQFVTNLKEKNAEEISVGGSDNVDFSVFKDFDYTALGHIHSEYAIGNENIRYSGTPLKYSFSEVKDKKSVTIVEINEKNNISIKKSELKPLHNMSEIKGTYDELYFKEYYENTTLTDDYLHIILTDEEDVEDAFIKLRLVYKNLLKLDYDNSRTRSNNDIDSLMCNETKTPFENFEDFFKTLNNTEMNEEQKKLVNELINSIWEVN